MGHPFFFPIFPFLLGCNFCVVVYSARHLHRLPGLGFKLFHFVRLYILFFRFFLRSDIPFSFCSPTFFEIGQSFLRLQGVANPNIPVSSSYSPPI